MKGNRSDAGRGLRRLGAVAAAGEAATRGSRSTGRSRRAPRRCGRPAGRPARPSREAAALSASQNGASSEMEVRWPPMVKERLTGRPVGRAAARVIGAAFGSLHDARPSAVDPVLNRAVGPAVVAARAVEAAGLQRALGRGLGPLALGDAEARALLVRPALALGLLLLLAVAVEVDDFPITPPVQSSSWGQRACRTPPPKHSRHRRPPPSAWCRSCARS